jgi:hypothetical protein
VHGQDKGEQSVGSAGIVGTATGYENEGRKSIISSTKKEDNGTNKKIK